MKASATYPTDSLRSLSFLKTWGHTPTLMDYSRFNYLVQPEDNIPVELLTPVIGPYDKWATMWGYKPIASARTPEAERATLDQWAREQDTKPWLRFSTSGQAGSDPGDETEAVGDQDAVKATGWGIKNIKREMAYLMGATVKPTEGFDDLGELYGRLIGQWRTELTHVTNIIGGAESQEKYGSQQGVRFTPVAKARQQAAVKFLGENAFATPTFFLDDNILRRIEPSGSVMRVYTAQNAILSSLLQTGRMVRLSEHEAASKTGAYALHELLDDTRHGIFGELATGAKIDIYRRTLQRAYVENLNLKLNPAPAAAGAAGGRAGGGGGRGGAPQLDPKLSDVNAAVRAELKALDAELKAAWARSSDRMTKDHITDLRHRIADAIKGKAGAAGDES